MSSSSMTDSGNFFKNDTVRTAPMRQLALPPQQISMGTAQRNLMVGDEAAKTVDDVTLNDGKSDLSQSFQISDGSPDALGH